MTVRHPPTALQDPIALDALADLDSAAADQWLAALTQDFAASAGALDRDAIFPHDNLARLAKRGLACVDGPARARRPRSDAPASAQSCAAVARGEPSTALILVMQCLYHLRLQANPNWPQALKERVARDAVENGALINSLRVEPELGSPSRGGLPGTIGRLTDNGDAWILNGSKIYSTGSPGPDVVRGVGPHGRKLAACGHVPRASRHAGDPLRRAVESPRHAGDGQSRSHLRERTCSGMLMRSI